jgi:hypothetical protein
MQRWLTVVVFDSQGDTLGDQHSSDLLHRRDLGSIFHVENRGLVELFLLMSHTSHHSQRGIVLH